MAESANHSKKIKEAQEAFPVTEVDNSFPGRHQSG
jgi:hypothetical protein